MISSLARVLICLFAFNVSSIGAKSSRGLGNIHSKPRDSRGLITARNRPVLALDNSKAEQIGSLDTSGDATILSSTFNLAKNIIGAGVLSLPSAIAFFSDDKLALVPASALIVIMGILSAYTFSLIGEACAQHKVSSYKDAWAKSVDPKSAWLISAGTTCFAFLGALAFSIIVGDSFSALAETFNLPALFRDRTNVILTLTLTVLLPLCSMKTLNALAPFSILGLAGIFYTAIFMGIRVFDGTYNIGGKFFTEAAVFGAKPISANPLIFVLLSMLSMSYICHYNAPRFLTELKNPTLARYNTVTVGAFAASMVTYLFIAAVGFLTFGKNCLGFILNNYSGADPLASIARLSIGGAIISGYPFTFCALKDGILDLANVPVASRSNINVLVTSVLMAVITALALVLKDVGFVVSLGGALFGGAVMFCAPAMMKISNLHRFANKNGRQLTRSQKLEVILNYGIFVLGVIMTVVGVAVSVLKEMKSL